MAELQGPSDVRSPSFWDVPCLRSQDIPGIGTDAESDPPSPGPSTAPLLLPSDLRMSLNLYEPQFLHLWAGDAKSPQECCKETKRMRDTKWLIDKAASPAPCLKVRSEDARSLPLGCCAAT